MEVLHNPCKTSTQPFRNAERPMSMQALYRHLEKERFAEMGVQNDVGEPLLNNPRSPFLAKFGCPEFRDTVTYCTPYFKIHTNTDWHFPLFASFKDGEHEGLFAVLLCRVVGGRTKVVTNNDINIASWHSLKVMWSMVFITQPELEAYLRVASGVKCECHVC